MSKKTPQMRSSFASRTAFEALAIDNGEESDEETVEEPTAQLADAPYPPDGSSGASTDQPAKPTRSAQKKAARLAREHARKEKRNQKRSSSSGSTEPPSTLAAPETSPRDPSPPGSKANPVEVPPEPESSPKSNRPPAVQDEVQFVLAPAPAPRTATANTQVGNGHVRSPQTDQPTARSPMSASYSRPPAFPTSPMDMAMRTASQSLAVGPLGKKSEPDTPTRKAHIANAVVTAEAGGKDQETQKKRQSFFVRTLWTLIMIGGFLLCLAMGHAYMILLVMVCQTLVYHEVTALFSLGVEKTDEDAKRGKDPWSKTLNWYFFAVTNYFLYGESIIYYFKHVVFADIQLSAFAMGHRLGSFTLYMLGFVGFVASLQRQYLKSQFGLFCWVHMSLLVIVFSSHFIINNILEGLIWFWVPASLVICNDIFAYIWGITIGRTPLIKLSPKKTVEGFIGAFFSTIVFGLIWGTFFMRFEYMICPARDLGQNAFSDISCTPNRVFIWREFSLWPPVRVALSTLLGRPVATIPYAPYQIHLLVMSCFASLVAPFGGFFASGFKRAFNIKDFGHSIPGHGGMTDRMDCQFLMGVFTYVYYSSLIKEHHVTVGHILQLIVSSLTLEEQLELYDDFKKFLEGRGLAV